MDVSSLIDVKKNARIPDITPGDTVRVSTRIVEGDKERIQVFQGVVIKIKRGGNGAGYTVRHVAFGIGVERTFPMKSPLVEKVEIVRQGKVRRSRLYYLRNLSGKEARRKIKRVERKVGEELLAVQPEEVIEPVMDEAAVAAAAAGEAEAKAVEEKPAAGKPAAKAPEAVKGEKKADAPEAVKEEKTPAAPAAVEEKAPADEKKEAPEKPAEPSVDQK